MPKTNNMEPVKAGTINIIDGPMFGGKCHPPGTKILMYDGTIKNVEDIKQGDFLMGVQPPGPCFRRQKGLVQCLKYKPDWGKFMA
jgi:hypothetical protein